jgi:hypothetical protein
MWLVGVAGSVAVKASVASSKYMVAEGTFQDPSQVKGQPGAAKAVDSASPKLKSTNAIL